MLYYTFWEQKPILFLLIRNFCHFGMLRHDRFSEQWTEAVAYLDVSSREVIIWLTFVWTKFLTQKRTRRTLTFFLVLLRFQACCDGTAAARLAAGIEINITFFDTRLQSILITSHVEIGAHGDQLARAYFQSKTFIIFPANSSLMNGTLWN